MFTAKEYLSPKSLEEIYTLNKKRPNAIAGGLMWLKQSHKNINTLIDLTHLKLEEIQDSPDYIELGAYVTLSQLINSKELYDVFGNYFEAAIKPIVGVQFRNTATLGGSVYARYGFSDIITALAPLNAQVKIYDGEEKLLPISEYAQRKKQREVVLSVIIPKENQASIYKSIRLTATDFPLLNLAISKSKDKTFLSIGARPMITKTLEISTPIKKSEAEKLVDNFNFGSNLRASEEYRRDIAKALLLEALTELKLILAETEDN